MRYYVDAAGRVVKASLDAINGLAQFPLMGRDGVKPGTRERILTLYPYKVIYEINGETVEIDRVLHTAHSCTEGPVTRGRRPLRAASIA